MPIGNFIIEKFISSTQFLSEIPLVNVEKDFLVQIAKILFFLIIKGNIEDEKFFLVYRVYKK